MLGPCGTIAEMRYGDQGGTREGVPRLGWRLARICSTRNMPQRPGSWKALPVLPILSRCYFLHVVFMDEDDLI